MISADTKTDAKQEIKELVAVSYNFSQKHLLKTLETQWKTGLYIPFNYWLAFHPA